MIVTIVRNQLLIPQVATVFVVQGEAMQTVGVFDASMMTNFDSISVIVSGLLVQRFLYPALERRGIRMKYTHKFAFGTGLSAMAVLCSLIIDYKIHSNIDNGREKINIFYQIFPYAFVGKCLSLLCHTDADFLLTGLTHHTHTYQGLGKSLHGLHHTMLHS